MPLLSVGTTVLVVTPVLFVATLLVVAAVLVVASDRTHKLLGVKSGSEN